MKHARRSASSAGDLRDRLGRPRIRRGPDLYMTDDPAGLARVFDTVDLLAGNPRPTDAFAWGVDRFRIHVGRYRVIYQITEKTVTITVIHLGRTG